MNTKNDIKKARNKVAAKKWRNKKKEGMYQLQEQNDELREIAYNLYSQVVALQTENKVLEEELRFFQVFMSKIMSTANQVPKKSAMLLNPIEILQKESPSRA